MFVVAFIVFFIVAVDPSSPASAQVRPCSRPSMILARHGKDHPVPIRCRKNKCPSVCQIISLACEAQRPLPFAGFLPLCSETCHDSSTRFPLKPILLGAQRVKLTIRCINKELLPRKIIFSALQIQSQRSVSFALDCPSGIGRVFPRAHHHHALPLSRGRRPNSLQPSRRRRAFGFTWYARNLPSHIKKRLPKANRHHQRPSHHLWPISQQITRQPWRH